MAKGHKTSFSAEGKSKFVQPIVFSLGYGVIQNNSMYFFSAGKGNAICTVYCFLSFLFQGILAYPVCRVLPEKRFTVLLFFSV